MANEKKRLFTVDNKKLIHVATALCFAIEAGRGMDTAVFNTLQPFIIEHFGTSLTQSSLFNVAGSLGQFLINYIILRLADRYDKVNMLTALVLLLSAVLLAIGGAPTMGVFVFLKFLQGMVSPFMDNVCTGYTSDLHSSRRGSAVGVLFMCFSLASALMPTFNTFVVDTLGLPWYKSYQFIGFYLLGVGLLFLLVFGVLLPRPQTEFTSKKNMEEKKKLSIREMFQNRNMRALFVANVTMSFYNYFSMMLPTYFYLTNADVYTTAIRGSIATAASIGRLCSRVLYVPLSKKIDTIWYMRFQALVSTLINLSCFIIDNPYVWMAALFCSGLIVGSSF
ncbi:MAG: MFS transporter, partial [Oscillospiraceae bacterium]|nr:MFS transporter [Oscillospiraceae bacterium]